MGFAKAISAFLVLALAGTAVFFGIHSLHPAGAASNPQQSPLAPPVNMLITGPAPDEKATVSSPISPTDPHAVITAKRRNAAHHLADDPAALSTAASHIKIWQPPALEGSDALSLASSDLKLWEPQTPAEYVQSEPGADASLVSWIDRWQKRFTDPTNVETFAGELDCALNRCQFTPAQCVRLVSFFSRWEDRTTDQTIAYHMVSAAFARKAIWLTSSEVRINPGTIEEAQKVVAPLIRRLWWGVKADIAADQLDIRAVKEFYTLLWQFNPEGTPDYHRGQEGRIEAMILLRELAAASSEAAEALSKSATLGADEQSDFLYLRGWATYGLGKYTDAEPLLRRAAERANSEKAERSIQLLTFCQARLGDDNGVSATLVTWVHRFHPDANAAEAMFSSVDAIRNAAAVASGR